MKKFFLLAILTIVVLACSLFTPAAPPTEIPVDTPTSVPTETPTSTPTDLPMPTLALGPTLEPTPEPLAVPTIVQLPQQWNGTYTYNTGQKQNISFIIEKVDETEFTGKMVWQSFDRFRGAILKMNGYFITDFGDETEQAKWSYHKDFGEDTSGNWLKWTETEVIQGANYTVNGWYYAHIRDNGTMVAIYFFSKDAAIPDNGEFVFQQLSP
jgi:hypothetical protein